ncbi:DUF6799 domain-containing protein [Hymenobacter glacialis]|uniref:DUF6799 domain-containing protein n=1 Tax=Hymenobacter glacialis TaxID=1908236 RepID=A0A1G1T1B3_9BACT|nr:DUF6799 domain-containing protein [Hymenobacter glacialis]OGX84673.1 hypothetical protein BEN48_02740 [Hymenobacter glacialis]
MIKPLLTSLFLSIALLAGGPQRAQAQANGAIPWFTVQNYAVVVQNGANSKPLDRNVTLPNGIQVEYRTQSLRLADGSRVPMQEGDVLSLNGEFIRKKAEISPAPAPARTVAAAPAPAATKSVASAAFKYQPAAPVNGKLKGVVELGASGFNMFIIRIDTKRNWKLEKSEFGNSLVMENMATEEDIRNGLKTYIGKMLDFGVAGRDIHFVVSSGASMAEGTRRIVKSLEALKFRVNTVTPESEGVLGLQAAMPKEFADKAFVVDMGSGNTKISWMDGSQPRTNSTYGAKYYEKGIEDATVAADVKAKAGQVPTGLSKTCFIIGGVPYEMAKAVRQGDEPYTTLLGPDAYPQLGGAKSKAGLNIYQAVAAATGCTHFVFGYDTNFTIGYLLSLP